MDGIYKNIQEYNSNKKTFLIVFDDIVADILNNKRLNSIVTELSIRGRKLNISLVFYFEILFCCTENYQAKFYTLFHHENSKKARVSVNCI